ncbi:sugar phosphate isomerase/epimerase family protein [Urbifossiella limnaea]|uniref:D-tagatose 3-epimerase n=1 Tax=Urbifossiella limnaea TaxID=2528023 RepID=A0A517XRP9_9BACT|nr:sugar phosphate isomerase/epimerase family protein [Urbifossiella limnaea]QDU20153.1 D-tagatose 3-epimerase [Urbifossiella limnaea]
MKLAVSNIAWPVAEQPAVLSALRELGVTAVEVAPTKLFADPSAAAPADVDAAREWWADQGFAVVAAQALLFGRPDLTLFDSAEVRERTLEYLGRVLATCGRLGAGACVFGSPKNRRRGDLPGTAARDTAVPFFRRLAAHAADAGTTVVLEANPPRYGADFVTRAADAVELVRVVDHPAFRLHLDTACMTLAGDPLRETFEAGFALLGHFHVSEPDLAAPGARGAVDHAAFAGELKQRGYAEWVSVEMREPTPFTTDAVSDAVRLVRDVYSRVGSDSNRPA